MKDGKHDDLTIIAIGSSAGGLEAIRELVAKLPAKLPVSYVVVQHMSPHHKSFMNQLVARQTELQVQDVTDGVRPQANVIYLTPPKADVVLEDGLLRLKPPSELPSAPKPSVDRFLLSLADDHGEKSMAMILSGTGTDGANGIRAIRAAGGITIAQDAESAKYDGMPQAAIQTGCVDLVLPPAEIGTHLNKILTSDRDFSAFRKNALKETPVADLLQMLLAHTRVDFREYKQTTITRRIDRQMTALGMDDQDAYLHFLRANPHALDALFKDLLISVTRFFRDKDEFENLKSQLPKLIEGRPSGPFRIWIAGCATGEEAYSIAMLICEALGGPEVNLKEKVQIFATDIDTNALQIARRGIYGNAALNDIPKDLAAKYLTTHGDGIRVIDNLRSAILFSEHNVCQDPPFQKVHLLCCRNLLIYFGSSLQKKVLARFHYSMTSDALLFLGTAESVAGSDELFVKESVNSHVFRRRSLGRSGGGHYTMPSVPSYSARGASKPVISKDSSADRQLFDALIKSFGPNSILVTDSGNIIQVNGSISPYIEVNQSSTLKMHLDLLKSPLREEARSLVAIAMRTSEMRSGARHRAHDGQSEDLQLSIYPIVTQSSNDRVAVIVFNALAPRPDPAHSLPADETLDDTLGERLRDLENEVAVTREALQQTIEQLETSNEELQSLNKEMQSTNEELQATNEELETSNEELQSTNEELITVNEELQVTASELSGRTGELTSVLQSTPLAILVTDSALQISQATMAASDLFEIDRPIASPHISQLKMPEGFPTLSQICSETLRLGATTEHEFSSNGTHVLLSCTPYFDTNGKILGLTIVVTQFPGLAREMKMILETSHIYLMNRTVEGEILRISNSFADALGLARSEAVGRNLFDILPADQVAQAHKIDDVILKGDGAPYHETIQLSVSDTKNPKWLAMERHRFDDPRKGDPTILSIASDVTELVKASVHTNALLERFRHLQELAGFGYWELDLVKQAIFWSPKVFEIHGVPESDGEPELAAAVGFYHPDDAAMVAAKVEAASKHQGEFEFVARLIQKNGTEVKVRSHGIAISDGAGTVAKLVGAFEKID